MYYIKDSYWTRIAIVNRSFKEFLKDNPVECSIIINHEIPHICLEKISIRESRAYILCIEEEHAALSTLCGLELHPAISEDYTGNVYNNILFDLVIDE